jgi:hypothetical protein
MSNVRIVDKRLRLILTRLDAEIQRLYFKEVGSKNRYPQIYCVQDNHVGEPVMMACSRDGEPSHQVFDYEIVAN